MAASKPTDKESCILQCSPASVGLTWAHPNEYTMNTSTHQLIKLDRMVCGWNFVEG